MHSLLKVYLNLVTLATCLRPVTGYTGGGLTIWSDQEDEFARVALTAGLDEHDHLIMGVVRDIPPINLDHLVTFIQARHTQIGLKR